MDAKGQGANMTGGELQEITTTTYSFEELRKNDYLYVDKTALIHKIFLRKKNQFFLARPRRFGKSLLISTLKAIFEGRRELFKGLALDSIDYAWPKYPIIHLDMEETQVENAAELKAVLQNLLEANAAANGIPLRNAATLGLRFKWMIEDIAKTSPSGKTILLVDEYDKPLLGHLGKSNVTEIKNVLKAFYSAIKGSEGKQWVALITGVSKFSKVSIFSDLNNLTDLTMNHDAATLLGYTHAELQKNFAPHIAAYAEANGMTSEAAYAELEEWYDGYRFEEKAETVFNPVSIGKCLSERKLRNYWFETGTPTFLLNLIRDNPIDLGEMTASDLALSAYEPESPRLLPLLLQTGYLTIKGFERRGRRRIYTLGFPNGEVSESFTEAIVAEFCKVQLECESHIEKIQTALRDGDLENLFETLKTFFRGITYDMIIQKERFYQMVFHAIVWLAGGDIQSEVHTSTSRIDAVLKTKKRIFLFEFKLNGTVEDAMAQIREKRYYEKYLADGREIVLVGVEFDKKTRNIGKWAVSAPPRNGRGDNPLVTDT